MMGADDLDLESLLELSRTQHGRSTITNAALVPSLLHTLSSYDSSSLLVVYRLLRNLCAGETTNQNSFIKYGGVQLLSSTILDCEPSRPEIVKVGLQVLANVSTAGEEHQCMVWRQLFHSGFSQLAGVRDPGICDPLCMILYSCCCSSDDGGSRRKKELRGDKDGLTVVVKIIRTSSVLGYRGDWLQLLLSRLYIVVEDEAEESCFPGIFLELGLPNEPWFSAEQVFLLGILSEILSNEPLKNGRISDSFSTGIFEVFKNASRDVDFMTRGSLLPLPTGVPVVDVLGISLNILKDVCALTSGVSGLLSSLGLSQLLLSFLRNLEPPTVLRKLSSPSVGGWLCPYKGFRRDIVAVIGNIMYGRKEVQDEIRRNDGILLLLQQCVVDEENPFLREWGLWAVRNLLDGNQDNQKVVAELELQGPINTSEISGMGLKVEIDRNSGRAKLVNN